MKKIILIAAAFVAATTSVFAGGLLTNTNQNAVFLRNPARDAAIAIDGVYSNPAGTAFLPKGLHLSLNWQAAFQKREISSTFLPYALNTNNPGVTTKDFVGKVQAPVIPSFQFAYVFNNKWSVSAQFAIGGGGGKCEFADGLPMFEKLIYSSLATGIAMSPALPAGSSLAGYTMQQSLTGEQYFYGLQVGGTYKFNNMVSVFGGVRGILANASYVGQITGISGDVKLPAAYGGTVIPDAAATQDLVLDCSQNGLGIQPIVGVDVNLGKLNLAAKYEFRGVINLKNKSNNSANVDAMFDAYKDGGRVRSDIPALLTVGAQYSVIPSVRLMAGYHYYFDKDAKGSATDVSDNTWEVTFGAEWDVTKKLTVSAGAQRTQYGFADADMNDLTYNINSTGLCLGASYRISETVNINAGYMHSFYDNHTVVNAYGADNYTRKNDVFGVSVDLHF